MGNVNGINGQVVVLFPVIFSPTLTYDFLLLKLIRQVLNLQTNEKSLQRWLDHELEVMVNVHEVRFEYEKQSQV